MTAHDLTDEQLADRVFNLEMEFKTCELKIAEIQSELAEISIRHQYFANEMRKRIQQRSKQHGITNTHAIDESSID